MVVEFLCETEQVDPGGVFRPREETGSKEDLKARLRQEAVAIVRAFLTGFRDTGA